MENKTWIVVTSLSALILGFLGGMFIWRPDANNQTARLEARALEEKQKTISSFEDHVTQLRKDLEESSNQITKVQARLDDAKSTLRSAEQKLKTGSTEDRVDEARREKANTESRAQERLEHPGIYEASQVTSVYTEPSVFSRKVATVPKGTRIMVVGTSGEWLEVRSRHGNPPGFIQREHTKLVRSGADGPKNRG